MSDLTSKGIPLLGETDADKRATLNAALQKVDQLLGISGGGGTGAFVSTLSVSANLASWTDTNIDLDGADALTINAQGLICHNASDPLYGPENSGGAYLTFCVVTGGATPSGDMTGQIDYRASDSIFDATGRVWARIRDAGGNGDNRGSFDLTLVYFADAQTAYPLLRNRRKSLTGAVAPTGPSGPLAIDYTGSASNNSTQDALRIQPGGALGANYRAWAFYSTSGATSPTLYCGKSGDIVHNSSAIGHVFKSPNGHYWRTTVSDAGVLTTTDLGTTLPI